MCDKIKISAASILCCAAMAVSGCANTPAQTTAASESAAAVSDASAQTAAAPADTEGPAEKNTMSALDAVKAMGNGINLGNTMEAYNHKAYLAGTDPTSAQSVWGMPLTTKEMIEGMKSSGFDSLRVPVAWTNGMNFESGDYTIDARLLDRVEEIVCWALDCDMYVIINDHWDGSWWGMFGSASEETRAKALEMYKSMWSQIAERFGKYGYKLIFESANEELGDRLNDKDIAEDSGTLSKDQCFETTNMINSEFVKLIRSTGGYNAERFLLIAGYNTDIANTCDKRYKMPEDTVPGKLMISVHYYGPWDYCGTKAVQSWGSPLQYEEMNSTLQKMTKFTLQGYGVIIGEYGVLTDGKATPKPDTDIYYTNFLNNCDLYNYCPMLWDCNGIFRRNEGKIADETIRNIYLDRSLSEQSKLSDEEIKEAAQKGLDEGLAAAKERMTDANDIPPSDDYSVAWIMYQASDYNASYCVGDIYDPTNKSAGARAVNAKIEGEGTYTISLDLTGAGSGRGVNFSAIGISNGEKLFPGYTITITSFKVNGEETELDGKGYTSSDNGVCTRMNLNNPWVNTVPDGARTADGSLDGASAQIWKIGNKARVDTIEITFDFKAP